MLLQLYAELISSVVLVCQLFGLFLKTFMIPCIFLERYIYFHKHCPRIKCNYKYQAAYRIFN